MLVDFDEALDGNHRLIKFYDDTCELLVAHDKDGRKSYYANYIFGHRRVNENQTHRMKRRAELLSLDDETLSQLFA